ncbi:MAG: hypothetical protein JSU63_10760 [Phycisphaerales bacterium]|nr:MAG: hypothetical protein JSU63_10760 [Phycisphaerales bacterium]
MILLSPYQRQQLHAFILDAFDGDDLEVLVGIHLGARLADFVDLHQDQQKIVLDLIEEFEGRGELEALLRGILKARPKRDDIVEFCRTNFAHVLDELAPETLIEDTANALRTVADFLADPQVRQTVGRFQADFRTIEERTRIVSGYKQLHEVLHVLQWQVPAIQDAAERFDTDVNAARLLSRQLLDLRRQVARTRERADGLPTAMMEKMWIDELDQAVKDADKALKTPDGTAMTSVVSDLRVLLRESARIDGQLAVAVSDLPLGKLLDALGEIDQSRSSDAATKGGSASQQIRDGRDALRLIRPKLAGLVAQHNNWQSLDKELAGIETNPGYRPEDKVPRWRRVKDKLKGLCNAFSGDDWSVKIMSHLSNWEAAAQRNESQTCEIEADSLRTQAMDRFFGVDTEMRDLCENLVKVGRPLKTLLEAYTNENP